ncbi:MAG TPA: SIR2 family protein [Thermoanaerobaculia bacterium]|nr:SIR2 family protein [Thermoanaerobaculia bacterium]
MLRWQLIVVDDRNDFALSVWRYVTRTVGIDFDHEEAETAAESSKGWLKEDTNFDSSDGEICFRWIEANETCCQKLRSFLAKVPSGRGIYLLIDVKGKKDSGYDAEILCRDLRLFSEKRSIEWQVVSSYPSSKRIEGRQVQRKSIDTLGRVRRKLYEGPPVSRAVPKESPGSDPRSRARHILVTGAGFEIVDKRGGFGMPPTREVLKGMGPPFRIQEEVTQGETPETERRDGGDPVDFWIDLKSFHYRWGDQWSEGFPIPYGLAWEGPLEKALKRSAKNGELDLYWDIILEESLRHRLGAAVTRIKPGVRDQEKSIALHRERRMREAFRKSILDHDWGYMNQSLAAAKLHWHAWLTTNYTKFADRALHLVDDRRKDDPQAPYWRIISTASEANISVREDTGSKIKESGAEGRNCQYLFKLHGDIAHLHTMAVAGHDKDLVNPLCVPVESLYQIYAAADRFLRNSLWNAKERTVIWHLVGHGLQDIRLFKLIQSVCSRSAPRVRHIFLLINPQPEAPLQALDRLSKDPRMRVRRPKFAVLTWKKGAAEYMARLDRKGLGWLEEILDLKTLQDLEAQWRKEKRPKLEKELEGRELKPGERRQILERELQKEMEESLQSRLEAGLTGESAARPKATPPSERRRRPKAASPSGPSSPRSRR